MQHRLKLSPLQSLSGFSILIALMIPIAGWSRTAEKAQSPDYVNRLVELGFPPTVNFRS
jgi:hypothetical protein